MRLIFLFLFLFFLGGVYLVFRGDSWAAPVQQDVYRSGSAQE